MKKYLKYFLLLPVIVLFLCFSLELNSEERAQNYEKESHSYVLTKGIDLPHCTVAVTVDILESEIGFQFQEDLKNVSLSYALEAKYDPPERLHLLHSVFLI